MNKTSNILYAEETYAIRGAIFEVYKEMGHAFEEAVYQECLELAFEDRSIPFEPQQRLPLNFKTHVLKHCFIPDFVCFGKIIVEIKACAAIAEIHRAQLLDYLRLTGMKVGLLVNFGSFPKVAIERMVL